MNCSRVSVVVVVVVVVVMVSLPLSLFLFTHIHDINHVTHHENATLDRRYKSRKNEVITLLGTGDIVYKARGLMAIARKAISMATEVLDQRHVRDIDSQVVGEALYIVKNNLTKVVKLTFDDYAEQRKQLGKMGVSVPPSQNAPNAKPIGKSGSFWAWHGSAMMSWHFILRTGLRNLSGTTLQQFGAAYGSGVYFGKSSNVSTGYACNSHANWSHLEYDGANLSGANTMCLALCEIINRPEDFTSINPYYVVPNEDFITTRFIFLFEKGASTSPCNAMSVNIPKGLVENPPRQ